MKRTTEVKRQITGPEAAAKDKLMLALSSVISSRASIARTLGKTFGNKRDLYEVLGYPTEITIEDYYGRYERGDIASRIVDIFPDETWEKNPKIVNKGKDDEKFQEEWESLQKRLKIYSVMKRADILAGIGEYSVILIGFIDSGEFNQPVASPKGVAYLQPYGQKSVEISKYEEDKNNERYGLPLEYEINTSKVTSATRVSRKIKVHYSRVIHVADNILESETHGTPRLQKGYNRLLNLDLIVGGSAEMFWQGAFQGLAFLTKEDYDLKDTSAVMTEEIDKFVHGLQRYMKLKGVDIETLQGQVADPKSHYEVLINVICITYKIPLRILEGSEKGGLNSGKDSGQIDEMWTSRVEERRINFNEPCILRPFVDRMITHKIIPEPKDKEYIVEWPDLLEPTQKETADIAKVFSEAYKTWFDTDGASVVMDPFDFFKEVLGFSEEKIDRLKEAYKKNVNDLLTDIEEGEEFEEEDSNEDEDES